MRKISSKRPVAPKPADKTTAPVDSAAPRRTPHLRLEEIASMIVARVDHRIPADLALKETLREFHQLPAAFRRQITQAVFSYFRWARWLDHTKTLRVQTLEAIALQERFIKNPRTFKDAALAALAVPDWTWSEIALSENPAEARAQRSGWLRQLQQPTPTLWIRARPGSATTLAQTLGGCSHATSTLAKAKGDLATLAYYATDALNYNGFTDLFRTESFQNGAFEIQDLASQIVSAICAPKVGETWWDTCAGEGGKSLHLADLMHGEGLLWCSDRSARRLSVLKQRFSRAQRFNYRVSEWDGSAKLPTKTRFDGILIDAPCSNLGTWQRNPDARWSTIPDDVRELAAIQTNLLHHAAPALKPGGILVYAVCTLTTAETKNVAAAFTAAHPEFEPVSVFPDYRDTPEKTATQLFLWPHELNANGMFIATWRKR